jgi:hypothetical protein
MTRDYSKKVKKIVKAHQECFAKFKSDNTFAGPSLHFHLKALKLRNEALNRDRNVEEFLEAIYAALVSWGMHRMGGGGPKMVDFKTFHDSITEKGVWASIQEAKKYSCGSMSSDPSEWDNVKFIYDAINIMGKNNGRQIRTYLVGRSKVLAHLLPNIVAPIDREYTLKFLHGNKNIYVGKDNQWSRFQNITKDFYHPLAQNSELKKFYSQNKKANDWNTSILKFVDNLVIGCGKKK